MPIGDVPIPFFMDFSLLGIGRISAVAETSVGHRWNFWDGRNKRWA